MTVNTSADDAPIVAPNSVTAVIAGLLRVAVQPGQGWSYETLEAATGLKTRRLKSYVHEGKEPSLSAALSIAVALGPRAVQGIMAIIGYTARPLDDGEDGCPMARVATTMLHLSTITTAAADGRIDHTEQPATQLAVDAIIAELIPLSSHANAC